MFNAIGELIGLIIDGARDFVIGKTADRTRPWTKKSALTLILICIVLLFMIPILKDFIER